MCGIFGYIGPRNPINISLEGLRKLEYRGYDSAGIAGIHNGKIEFCKEVGKISTLQECIEKMHMELDLAIAQTRWATHGQPTKINAHPHLDNDQSVAIVHNGIIENYESLRKMLTKNGARFISQTDSEVIAHLIAYFYKGNFLHAVQQAVPLLKGSFAVAAIHRDHPGIILTFAREMPLIIGVGDGEMFVSSDAGAFVAYTRDVIYLDEDEIAVIRSDHVDVYGVSQERVNKQTEQLSMDVVEANKGEFDHFTLKEIFEQPQSLRSALLSRFNDESGNAVFEELTLDPHELSSVERILIIACGTSWHAGFLASYLFEDIIRIPVQVEIASEYRYKNPVVTPNTLVIAISQSGETADTVAAVRELKNKGSTILAICNVYNSTLVREADSTLFLRAGPEIGVCSTKAFTSQYVVLGLFCILMARMRNLGRIEGRSFLRGLQMLPSQVQIVLDRAEEIKKIAKKYASFDNFFFLGRRYMFPTCLEGALKLKEISYVNANGYPAGEMKHGPIALIGENCPTVAFCANKVTCDKLISNLMEVKARNGAIVAIAEEGEDRISSVADDVIWIPSTMDEWAPIPATVAAQLFAYYIAAERGAEIDQPRNLAKSVTVE